MEKNKKNFKSEKIVDVQRRLKLLGYSLGSYDIDGILGGETSDAIKRFQQDRGLLVTGLLDQETWQGLVDAGYKVGDRLLYLKYPSFRGDDVKAIQFWLKSLGFYPYNENGIFCEKTQKALIEFQRNLNISDDGMAGEETIRHLKSLRRVIVSKETSNFPLIKNFEKSKQGKVKIILDYGEDIEDIKNVEKYYKEKIYICRSIVNFCSDILVKNGVETILTVKEDESQSLFLFDRINYANSSDAGIILSIGLNYSIDKGANGSSCFYFKGFKSYSIAGRRIANLIQDKLVHKLGLLDCRVHGAGYAVLKETSMTSVLIEPAFISNKKERENLKNTEYQNKISTAISEAVLDFLRE